VQQLAAKRAERAQNAGGDDQPAVVGQLLRTPAVGRGAVCLVGQRAVGAIERPENGAGGGDIGGVTGCLVGE
jgi:hypothetical protein